MYGLPQAVIVENKLLTWRLEKHRYCPFELTPGLWNHCTTTVTFCLMVYYLGVKYVGKEHVTHLVDVLQQYYKISINWGGNIYCE